MIRQVACTLASLLFALTTSARAPQETDEQLKKNLRDKGLVGTWIYDDIEEGYAEAKKSGKPLMIVFRCVP
ncbi:MAG: hypothetical protein A2Z34_04010 [Planctomycetes bacterium RBG_16_59_8]|nr:MAG: hypothetical protein A2Z34_04010 [Planctomycetes bacterium RBG_16_59_8]